ncbi:ATP-binding protein [Pseudomonas canadensis]|uniref:ATP-binding protein n=1 Tax=Pseudomonas allii TaxID=2740531 RepID=A0A7Y8RJR4_9PSED|nr:ATP-binding protein [Pseudomonas allii]NWN46791.1 ATP-binding protein [Pseudomonas allii]NWN59805.1 ATP-binding protein [Pseudomonas allii]
MHNTHIMIPSNLDDKSLLNFFQGWKWIDKPVGPVKLDFTQVNFIAPYAVTLFAAYYFYLKEVKRKHAQILFSPSSVAGSYLVNSGFLELTKQGSETPNFINGDRIVKLSRIKKSSEIPAFANNVMQVLSIEDEEVSGAVKYSLIELLRNVVQHSFSDIGAVAMAQYYPNTGLVEICVADCGLGIAKTLSEAYPEIDSDMKAVKFATQPHVSRTFVPAMYNSMQDNAGLGLFFIKQIAARASGSLFLGSGSALVDIWGDKKGEEQKIYKIAKKDGWPGTFAYLQLRKDSIAEFDQILQGCRHLAAEARKYPNELALDFITEIPEIDGLYVVKVTEFEEDVERASHIREVEIIPRINGGVMVVIDFQGVSFATQSFVHALMYKVVRDGQTLGSSLSIANCSNSTREAVMAVAAYAKLTPS